MNIVNILEEIEKVDGEIYERLSPRRKAMKDFWNMGSKVALSAMPLAFGSMLNKAYSATPSAIIDVLQYALTLEHFEYNFYKRGLEATGLPIPAGDQRNALIMIRDSELKHVNFLKAVIPTVVAGTAPVAEKTNYDFTAGNIFADVFTNYGTFLAVAQVLEDTGVRAYKGQAGAIKRESVVLTAALGIHAVEARHAAKIRYMRKLNGAMDAFGQPVKSWIAGSTTVSNDTGVAPANGNYGGATPENTIVQAGVTITSLPGIGGNISFSAAAEAFDEQLTKAEVLALVSVFNVS